MCNRDSPYPRWRVLFDLNVVLDVLMLREPHFANAARLWALAETNQVEGFIATHSFSTLFYLYRRQKDPARVYQAMQRLFQVFEVASVDRGVIEMACDLAWRDFEDAVQAMAGNGAGCYYLVTRNPENYGDQKLTVIKPADFLAVWSAGAQQKDE